VRCWGANDRAQLATAAVSYTSTPRDIPILASRTGALHVGDHHACVLTVMGGVECWGDNQYGQLGHGGDPTVPTDVPGLGSRVLAIAAGSGNTCAVVEGGDVMCWGYNSQGQLGTAAIAQSATPVRIAGLAGSALSVAVGGSHACAVLATRTVQCWGLNDRRQLGDPSVTAMSAATPVAVRDLDNVDYIALGASYGCARTMGGSVYCWGGNAHGELGTGAPPPSSATPARVDLGGGATAIATGIAHACAVRDDGHVLCWGWNLQGQLGNGGVENARTPVEVASIGDAVDVAAGQHHSCALLRDGRVQCWGRNVEGQLGDGTTENRAAPVDVRSIP
jgi:alpha-tubulin suppressor-like RCC1 family protein